MKLTHIWTQDVDGDEIEGGTPACTAEYTTRITPFFISDLDTAAQLLVDDLSSITGTAIRRRGDLNSWSLPQQDLSPVRLGRRCRVLVLPRLNGPVIVLLKRHGSVMKLAVLRLDICA